MIMDNLIKDYQGMLKEYRTLLQIERQSPKGQVLYYRIMTLRTAIDRIYKEVGTLSTKSLYGNYKPNYKP